MSEKWLIRDALPGDETEWRRLWQGYLDYYVRPLDPEVTAFTWARLLDPSSALSCRLVIRDQQALGFAIHHQHPSTWVMGDDCYLEDLFVDPQTRGQGVGRALIEDLIALARARGCKRLYWHTNVGNVTARALYDQLAQEDGHVRYRMAL